jgi:hypothetical protein
VFNLLSLELQLTMLAAAAVLLEMHSRLLVMVAQVVVPMEE